MGMFNPMSAVTSNLPSVGGDDKGDGDDKVNAAEQEKLRQEAVKKAEEERRKKHKRQEEERENIRQGIRDKYKIEKRENSDEEDEDEDDDFGGSKKNAEDDDPMMQKANEMKEMAEQGLNAAKDKCKVS